MTHCHLVDSDSVKCNWDSFHLLNNNEQDDELYFPGGKIEALISDAITLSIRKGLPLRDEHLRQCLDDSMPSIELATHLEMTKMAMRFANHLRFIPKEGRWHRLAKQLKLVGGDSDTKLMI